MDLIKHLVTIHAPASTVFENISSEMGLRQWWTDQTEAKAELHFRNHFRFGSEYHKVMHITEFIPNHSITWHCEGMDEEWKDTVITFRLEENEGKTVLHFVHGNWKKETDHVASCNYHWGYYMHSLKLLCETGAGTPFKPS